MSILIEIKRKNWRQIGKTSAIGLFIKQSWFVLYLSFKRSYASKDNKCQDDDNVPIQSVGIMQKQLSEFP